MFDYFDHLYLPGALAIWCALAFALATLIGYAQVITRDREGDRRFARRAYACFTGAVFLASLVLVVALLSRDFRIEYVYQYSGLELPWHYQLSAFWAGQKGSFLIWLLWGSILGLFVIPSAGRQEGPVMGVYTLTLMGLLLILVRENPFVMLSRTPVDGTGLNPLLQDNWMVIHPPIMFIGYAAAAVPFSFAIAAMWTRRFDDWARRAFPWALGGFLVLGTAILLGGYWAYKTLGWGGYWGWDPVENASLIPWLFGTVLIHGLHLERRRGRFRRANLVFACLVFLTVLYGTFLTRSGVLADFSVHSFVDLGISRWLVAFMGIFLLMSGYLLATRLPKIPTRENEDPLLSRGSFMVLSTITITVSAIVVTAGTSAPLLTRFLENPGQVGPDFYNRVNLPIALLVALLLAFVPFLSWRGNPPAQVIRRSAWALGVAGAATGLGIWLGVRDPFHVLFLFFAVVALFTNLQKTVALARSSGLRMVGGYLSHVGVGIILVGILASSAYDESAKVTLVQGEPKVVDDFTMTFNRFIPRQGREREKMEIEVVRADGSSYLAYPRLFVNDRTRQVMANPHIRKFPLQDLYISPIDFDPGRPGGNRTRLQLAQGETGTVGDLTVRFTGFDLDVEGHALAQMERGEPIAVGAALDVTRDGVTERVVPVYRFSSDGRVETPPTPLPGSGTVMLTAIEATTGSARIELFGIGEGGDAGTSARLSVDVTRKPLINGVWYGLYVVLAGGALATAQRLREAMEVDRALSRGG